MLNYSNAVSDNYGFPATYMRNQTLLLTLDLRTLGDLKAPIALSRVAGPGRHKNN